MSGGQDIGEASSSNKALPTEHQAHPERLPLREPQNGSRPLVETLFEEILTCAKTVKFTDKRHQQKIKLGEYALRAVGETGYIPSSQLFCNAFRGGSHVQMSMVFAMAFSGSCPKCNRNLEAEQPRHIQWCVLMTIKLPRIETLTKCPGRCCSSSCGILIHTLESSLETIDPLTSTTSDF